MAFGGGSGFSFGNSNNNNSNSGFGGFGNNNNTNTNTGFGANAGNTGFGTSTTAANPFGASTSTFGSNAGGFGANANAGTTSIFGGNKSTTNPFGANNASTGSLFGGNNNNASTGGFGAGTFGNNANANTNTGTFGSGSSGTFGAFGSNTKPAFGASATTTTPLFGQGGTGTTGGFGTSTSAFGGSGTGSALNGPLGPSEGTGSTPFAPTNEKEPNGTTNSFQTITFMQPYQKYSLEELRLADYNAGRRYGNGSGQPGAFGSSSFGGFGTTNTNTGGFGTTNANPFGSTTTTSSGGFGTNTTTAGFGGGGGGLFGNTANKPGGLFGATASSPSTGGGLFGSTNNNNTTAGGFGGASTGGFGTNTNTGGGLFGNSASKPAGGLFGNNTNNNTNTGTAGGFSGFGTNNAQPASNTSGGLFGNNNNSTSTNTGGLFGNNNSSSSTGGLFGNNNTTQKPGGLFGGGGGFGTTTTQAQPSGGLFGNTNTANTTGGGLFGNNNNSNTGSTTGLFGNTNSNTAGTGLFGSNNNTNTTTSGGLFGNTQNKPGGLFGNTTSSGGLFGGGTNTNTNNLGGLFGNNANTSSGGLFGNNDANKSTTSLFGTQSTNQPSGGIFGSTNNNTNGFGATQNGQPNNQQQQDQFKVSSLLDPNPYGQSSIWTGLPAPTPDNAKPVFTPLTATQKMKESMMKPPPSLRLNQSRYMTPPRRNGFGFSYSTYGTPNSAASTPGGASLSGSMYGSRGWSGGSFGRSFSKSASVQNLRAQFASDGDDIWKPGAFASAHRNSSGSIKRLTIDRSIRNDLFSRPMQSSLPAPERTTNGASTGGQSGTQSNSEGVSETSNKLKKRVSFDNNTSGGQLNGQNGALVRTESDDGSRAEEQTSESRTVNGGGSSSSRSKELAVVPEDRETDQYNPRPPPSVKTKTDPNPGEYWMKPSRGEMAKMPREKLQRFRDFQVGRYGCGQVTFNGTVDLTSLPMDDLYHKIVEIRLRSVTVYPDTGMKPPAGKGLNVPSTIAIENSWPRSRNQVSSATSGPVFDKHIERLKGVSGTEFVDYEVNTGVWTFRVPHYTRYGLDYDDDDDEDMSELTAPPDTIEKSPAEESVMEADADDYDHLDEDEDDTFAFKQKTVPGGFGRRSVIDYESGPPVPAAIEDNESVSSAYSEEEMSEDMSEDEPSMAGSYPQTLNFDSPSKPILKAPGTPAKPLLDLEGDWAEQLQRTISPRKQNRDMLRDVQNKVLLDRVYSPIKPHTATKQNFRTSVDIMSSIFGKYEEERSAGGNGRKQVKDNMDFEFPYAKRAKIFDPDLEELSEEDRIWHATFRAKFTETGDLLSKKRKLAPTDEIVIKEGNEAVVRSNLADTEDVYDINLVLASAQITYEHGIPFLDHLDQPFSNLIDQITEYIPRSTNIRTETFTYRLAHILFDVYDDKFSSHLPTKPASLHEELMQHVLHDRVSEFISSYIKQNHGDYISTVEKTDATEAAVLRLTYHDIKGACDLLQKAGNHRLMILVSQLGTAGSDWQDDVRAQLDAWREQGVLSEMSIHVRALYEICAGNVTISLGRPVAGNPVEDRAETFSISEKYGLDWLQAFAMGFWYGKDEKKAAKGQTRDGVVRVENAVQQYVGRCERGEENERPGDDVMWVLLKLYAASKGIDGVEMPIFPQSLDELNHTWDASMAFRLHHAIANHIPEATIDKDRADDLAGLLAWQLSSQNDVAGSIAVLLHLNDPTHRQEMIQTLLERFAGLLPDPFTIPSSSTNTTQQQQPDLWSTLTTHLQIPTSWLFRAKALHARAVNSDPLQELHYLIASHSWQEAHESLIHRVAPSCIVDEDYDFLAEIIDLFGADPDSKISKWEVGGGVYAEFVGLVGRKIKGDAVFVDNLSGKLVIMAKTFQSDGVVDLGKLAVEELEERVAIREMSRVVAGYGGGDVKNTLTLPITSDQRLGYTAALAGEYYAGLMGGHGKGVKT